MRALLKEFSAYIHLHLDSGVVEVEDGIPTIYSAIFFIYPAWTPGWGDRRRKSPKEIEIKPKNIYQVLSWESEHPGRKLERICKISDEKFVFSRQIWYIILRWKQVNSVKLCKFTASVSADLTKIFHISPLTTSYRPCTFSNLLRPVCQPLLPLRHFSLISSIFVLNLNQIHSSFCKTYALNFCKISGEITNFSGELWWFVVSSLLTLRWNYINSPFKKFQEDIWLFVGKFYLRLAVNLNNFIAFSAFLTQL